jgi:hypothetical protein
MVQVLPGISPGPRRGRPPRRLDHTLKRNKYPDSVFNHDCSYSVEAGRPCIRASCFPCDPEGATCMSLHFFTNFSAMFTSDTGTGRRGSLVTRPFFKEDAVPALKRALAAILSMNSREDAAGDLSGGCQITVQAPEYRRLPITKKSVERKDGGVVACQPVSLAHLHRIPHCRGDFGNQEYLYRRRGQELGYQSVALCLENPCYLLCPCNQFPEEFLDHSDNEKSVSGYLKNP